MKASTPVAGSYAKAFTPVLAQPKALFAESMVAQLIALVFWGETTGPPPLTEEVTTEVPSSKIRLGFSFFKELPPAKQIPVTKATAVRRVKILFIMILLLYVVSGLISVTVYFGDITIPVPDRKHCSI
jgi:hypothetical protein